VLLVVLVLAPIVIGGIGTVEAGIWLLLVLAWVYAFVFWARNSATGRR